jgi:hypothetical protein
VLAVSTSVSSTASVAVTSQLPEWMATSSPALIAATRALMSYSTVRLSRIVATWRPSTRTVIEGCWAVVTWCRIRSTSSVLPGMASVRRAAAVRSRCARQPATSSPARSTSSSPAAAVAVSRTAAWRVAGGRSCRAWSRFTCADRS